MLLGTIYRSLIQSFISLEEMFLLFEEDADVTDNGSTSLQVHSLFLSVAFDYSD
jgi:hypothetical protein